MAASLNKLRKLDQEKHDSTSPNTSTASSSTPVRKVVVPVGHVISADKWRGTELLDSLQKLVRVVYSDTTGIIDFQPATDMGVVYVTESEIITGTSYRRKLVKLRKANCMRGVVVVEKTPLTEQHFLGVQKFAVLELGLHCVPVTSTKEAVQLLAAMVNAEMKPHANPFKGELRQPPLDLCLLAAVQDIPQLGEIKAKALLERFGSLKNICNASHDDLTSVLGSRLLADNVKGFLS